MPRAERVRGESRVDERERRPSARREVGVVVSSCSALSRPCTPRHRLQARRRRIVRGPAACFPRLCFRAPGGRGTAPVELVCGHPVGRLDEQLPDVGLRFERGRAEVGVVGRHVAPVEHGEPVVGEPSRRGRTRSATSSSSGERACRRRLASGWQVGVDFGSEKLVWNLEHDACSVARICSAPVVARCSRLSRSSSPSDTTQSSLCLIESIRASAIIPTAFAGPSTDGDIPRSPVCRSRRRMSENLKGNSLRFIHNLVTEFITIVRTVSSFIRSRLQAGGSLDVQPAGLLFSIPETRGSFPDV